MDPHRRCGRTSRYRPGPRRDAGRRDRIHDRASRDAFTGPRTRPAAGTGHRDRAQQHAVHGGAGDRTGSGRTGGHHARACLRLPIGGRGQPGVRAAADSAQGGRPRPWSAQGGRDGARRVRLCPPPRRHHVASARCRGDQLRRRPGPHTDARDRRGDRRRFWRRRSDGVQFRCRRGAGPVLHPAHAEQVWHRPGRDAGAAVLGRGQRRRRRQLFPGDRGTVVRRRRGRDVGGAAELQHPDSTAGIRRIPRPGDGAVDRRVPGHKATGRADERRPGRRDLDPGCAMRRGDCRRRGGMALPSGPDRFDRVGPTA